MPADDGIADLSRRLEEANAAENAARENRLRIQVELERARGDDFNARWSQALLDHDHATSNRCYIEASARNVVRGRSSIDDYAQRDRVAIAAEVERIRAAAQGRE